LLEKIVFDLIDTDFASSMFLLGILCPQKNKQLRRIPSSSPNARAL
jgi:hypothetical protein